MRKERPRFKQIPSLEKYKLRHFLPLNFDAAVAWIKSYQGKFLI